MKGLLASEIVKAFEEGKEIQCLRYGSEDIEWIDVEMNSYLDLSDILQGFYAESEVYRVKGSKSTVVMKGRFFHEEWRFEVSDYSITGTHQISFDLDEKGNPICSTIKMIER